MIAATTLGGNGVAAQNILLNFSSIIGDLLPGAATPDFELLAGQLTINNLGPFAIYYEGTATARPYTVAGVNVGAATTLATDDSLRVLLLGTMRDSD